MGCILLLMQPTPLTGTATVDIILTRSQFKMQPTPLTGTATYDYDVELRNVPAGDAAHTPHGDGNC